MSPLCQIVSMSTPSPTPAPVGGPDPELVTPGFLGFAIVAFLVVAVVLLVWDMQRRIRRTRYRAEIDAELDAEERAAAVRASDTDDQVTDAADDDPRKSDDDPPRS